MGILGQYALTPFPFPRKPFDDLAGPDQVRGNDNQIAKNFTAHDADATIHIGPSGALPTGPIVVTGLLDISPASSGQIKFPAVQNPSSNAYTFDDYREDTYTPTQTGLTVVLGLGAITYAGYYTKWGRQVFVTIEIISAGGATTASTAGTTTFSAPFPPATNRHSAICLAGNASTGLSYGSGIVYAAGGNAIYPPSWAATSALVFITATYFV